MDYKLFFEKYPKGYYLVSVPEMNNIFDTCLRFVSPGHISALYGVTRQTVLNWGRAGKIHYFAEGVAYRKRFAWVCVNTLFVPDDIGVDIKIKIMNEIREANIQTAKDLKIDVNELERDIDIFLKNSVLS